MSRPQKPQTKRSALISLGLGVGLSLFGGCEENFKDVYIGPQGGQGGSAGMAGNAGSGGISGTAGAAGNAGMAGTDGGTAGSGGLGGNAGDAGSAGTSGSAGTAGAAGGCDAPRCQGKVRELCVNGAYITDTTCEIDCAGGSCLTVQEVSAGEAFACALLSDKTVRCWGDNAQGQLAQSATGQPESKPLPVPGTGAIQVRSGARHACLLTEQGEVRCWGDNAQGQIGKGSPGGVQTSPSPVTLPQKAKQIALGTAHTCALLEDLSVACWGNGELGQLGDGVASSAHKSPSPVVVQSIPTGAKQLDAGGNRTCILTSSGEVWCWGEQAIDETTPGAPVLQPTKIDGLSDALQLSLGSRHGGAVQGAGTVRCWGANDSGQLGKGDKGAGSASAVLVKNTSGSPVTAALQVTAGARHGCVVLDVSKTVQCWGNNDSGQLGKSGPESLNATTVLNLLGVKAISAGAMYTCARNEDGTKIWCWGANDSGQLGRGVMSAQELPGEIVW